MKRTPTPWTLARPGTDRSITVTFYAPDAPFIVRACNSHDALLELAEYVARSACLQQFSGDEGCHCNACRAQAVLKLANAGAESEGE